MNTMILFLKGDWTPETWVTSQGGQIGTDGVAVLERTEGWLSVSKYDDMADEYDDDDMALVFELINQPKPFLVGWRGDHLVDELLAAVPDDCDAVVDNDHGLIRRISRLGGKPFSSWARASVDTEAPPPARGKSARDSS